MDYEELKEKIEDMRKTHGDKYALYWAGYYLWKAEQEKLEEEAKKSLEEIQKSFEEHKKKEEELRFYREHPDLMPKITTPKEYGMSLNKKHKKKK